MKVFQKLSDLSEINQPIHLAMGVFDGVHIGHQKVIESAVLEARKSGGCVGVLTFEPHPIRVLSPERAPLRILASISHKARLLEEKACDFLLVQKFDLEFSALTAREFIEQLASCCKELASISVGEDWQFGKGRSGNVHTLADWGKELNFLLCAASPVMNSGERVSSTRIRQAIRDGNLEAIEEMLGRKYCVQGKVLEGRQLARELGFPTANIKAENEQLPPDGVWQVEVMIEGVWFQGVGNLGKRPTVENDTSAQRLLEVHLFGEDFNLYGEVLSVRFLSFVRKELKYASIIELKEQITKDVEFVKHKFSQH